MFEANGSRVLCTQSCSRLDKSCSHMEASIIQWGTVCSPCPTWLDGQVDVKVEEEKQRILYCTKIDGSHFEGNLNGACMRASKQGNVWKRGKETTIRLESLRFRRGSSQIRLLATLCYFLSQTTLIFRIFLLTSGLLFISTMIVGLFCPFVYVIGAPFVRITLCPMTFLHVGQDCRSTWGRLRYLNAIS